MVTLLDCINRVPELTEAILASEIFNRLWKRKK